MYNKDDVKLKIKMQLIRLLHLDEAAMNDDCGDISLESYGLNSIDALELILELENDFQYEFEDENLNFDSFKSLNSITDYIMDQLNGNSTASFSKEPKVKPIVIGIAGGSGSGKSTLSKLICEKLPTYTIKVISTDNFFLKVLPKNISPVSGKEYDDWNLPTSIDAERLIEFVKQTIADGGTNEIIIIEGISVLYFESLRSLLSLKLFVDLDSDERMYRRIKRNIEMWKISIDEVATYYLEMAKYSERQYFLNTKEYADIILNGNRLSGPGLDAIIAWISSRKQNITA